MEFHKTILENEHEQKVNLLKSLKEKLTIIKLTKEVERNNIVTIEDTLKWVSNNNSYIEPHINDFACNERKTENEKLNKKLMIMHQMLSASIILIFRICWQLGEDQNITKQNVVEKLSSIGLRLEHMITTVSKRKQNISNLESINTDTSYKYPPDFMGVKYFYATVSKQDTDEEETETNKVNIKSQNEEEDEIKYLADLYNRVKNGSIEPMWDNLVKLNFYRFIKQSDTSKTQNMESTRKLNMQLFERSKKDPSLKPISQLIHRAKQILD